MYLRLIGDRSINEREGIVQLKTFVTTKGSFPYHSRIIDTLSKFIQIEDDGIFDNLWIVLKAIMKNQPQIIESLIPKNSFKI